jgi:hypothetical protein
MPPVEPTPSSSDQDVLQDALQSVLMPLARLAVAKGLTFAATEEALKQAFVRAAQEAQLAQGLPAHRLVSRISTATGINRREVTRLTQADTGAPRPESASLVSQLFTRWLSDRKLRVRGKPRELPRQGEAPSFEALARSITQDVHPRSLLDELCRLGLARWDEASDLVSLQEDGFTPHGDVQRMLTLLGSNTGDHLQAAVDNVLSEEPLHFEQAVFAEGLSADSVDQLRVLARRHWKALLSEAVPLLEQRIEADAAMPEDEMRRVRLGLYSFHASAPPPHQNNNAAAETPRRPRKRT